MDLSIIIVNHNHNKYLKKNILSIISKTKSINFEIIIINNTISDNINYLKNLYNNLIIINNEESLGYSKNNNIGIDISKGKYIAVLNPDTYLHNNVFFTLINYLDSDEKIAICGPKILNYDGSLQYTCRKFPSLISTILFRTPIRFFIKNNNYRKSHLMMDFSHEESLKVDWMLGACLLFKKSFINEIGLFDENFFLYCEDIDLCFRTKKIGLECHYVPQAILYHEHQAESDKKIVSKRSVIHLKSMIHFIFKHKYFVY